MIAPAQLRHPYDVDLETGHNGKELQQFFTNDAWAERIVRRYHYFGQSVVEPGAGMGTFVKHIRQRDLVAAVEIDQRFRPYLEQYSPPEKVITADFLGWYPDEPVDLVIGNPPYSDRRDVAFVRHALNVRKVREGRRTIERRVLKEKGRVVFLLQDRFAATEGRWKSLWRDFAVILEQWFVPRSAIDARPSDAAIKKALESGKPVKANPAKRDYSVFVIGRRNDHPGFISTRRYSYADLEKESGSGTNIRD